MSDQMDEDEFLRAACGVEDLVVSDSEFKDTFPLLAAQRLNGNLLEMLGQPFDPFQNSLGGFSIKPGQVAYGLGSEVDVEFHRLPSQTELLGDLTRSDSSFSFSLCLDCTLQPSSYFWLKRKTHIRVRYDFKKLFLYSFFYDLPKLFSGHAGNGFHFICLLLYRFS
jgi:hypothetical protein